MKSFFGQTDNNNSNDKIVGKLTNYDIYKGIIECVGSQKIKGEEYFQPMEFVLADGVQLANPNLNGSYGRKHIEHKHLKDIHDLYNKSTPEESLNQCLNDIMSKANDPSQAHFAFDKHSNRYVLAVKLVINDVSVPFVVVFGPAKTNFSIITVYNADNETYDHICSGTGSGTERYKSISKAKTWAVKPKPAKKAQEVKTDYEPMVKESKTEISNNNNDTTLTNSLSKVELNDIQNDDGSLKVEGKEAAELFNADFFVDYLEDRSSIKESLDNLSSDIDDKIVDVSEYKIKFDNVTRVVESAKNKFNEMENSDINTVSLGNLIFTMNIVNKQIQQCGAPPEFEFDESDIPAYFKELQKLKLSDAFEIQVNTYLTKMKQGKDILNTLEDELEKAMIELAGFASKLITFATKCMYQLEKDMKKAEKNSSATEKDKIVKLADLAANFIRKNILDEDGMDEYKHLLEINGDTDGLVLAKFSKRFSQFELSIQQFKNKLGNGKEEVQGKQYRKNK